MKKERVGMKKILGMFQKFVFSKTHIKDCSIPFFEIYTKKTVREKVCKSTLLRDMGILGSPMNSYVYKGLLSRYITSDVPKDAPSKGSVFDRYTHFGVCKLDNSDFVWKYKVLETNFYSIIILEQENKCYNLKQETQILSNRKVRNDMMYGDTLPQNLFHFYSFSRGFFETDFAKDVFLEKVRNFKVA